MIIRILTAIAIAAVTYLVRVMPRFGVADYGMDTYFHLASADNIRKERNRQKINRFFTMGEYNDYPFLLHYLLVPFPKNLLEKYSAFINPVFDVLNVLLLYSFSLYMHVPPAVCVAIWLFYLASPQLTLESINLTPRLLGLFFFNLWTLSMIAAAFRPSLPWAAVAAFAGTACFFTIRFQLAIMLATGPLLWAVTGKAAFIEIEAVTFALCFCLNPRQFISTFASYCIKTYDYASRWRYYGDESERIKQIYDDSGAARKKQLITSLKNELRMLVSFNPAMWFMAAAGLMLKARNAEPAGIEHALWAWFLMSFWVFVFTQRFPQLGQRSGDGYRQFPMFGALPGAYIAGIVLAESLHNSPIFFAFLAAGLAGSLVLTLRLGTKSFKNKLKNSSSYLRPELMNVIRRVNDYPWGCVMCIPDLYNYAMIYYGNKRVVEVVGRSRPYKEKVSTYFVKLELPLEEYVRMFDLDYFFIDTSSARWDKDPADAGEIVEREGPYIFIKVKPELKK